MLASNRVPQFLSSSSVSVFPRSVEKDRHGRRVAVAVLFPFQQLSSFLLFSPIPLGGHPPIRQLHPEASPGTLPTYPASQLDMPGAAWRGDNLAKSFPCSHLNFPSVSEHQDLLKIGITLQTVLFQILERWSDLWIAFEIKLLKFIVL